VFDRTATSTGTSTGCPNKNLIASAASQILFVSRVVQLAKFVAVSCVKFYFQFAKMGLLHVLCSISFCN
jgi:hypothetical protein